MDFVIATTLSLGLLPTPHNWPSATRYKWRGHTCSFVQAGSDGPPILLVHGFAGSSYNCWRSTVPSLAGTHRVWSIDLLGLGASDQPADVEYSIALWREQCVPPESTLDPPA
jgi:pimeloyl-ACP methyl ester carboxylesterase